MFDDGFERSRVYFTILQILRIFGDCIRTLSADLHVLDDFFLMGRPVFPLNDMRPNELRILRSNWDLVMAVQQSTAERLLDRLSKKEDELKSLRDGV